MAEEILAEGQAPQAKGKGMKMLIIVALAALVLGGGLGVTKLCDRITDIA